MGDRCFSLVHCRPQDVPLFANLGYQTYEYDQADDCRHVILTDDQANYGNWTDLLELGKLDHPPVFIANNDEGDEYGPCVVACDGSTVDTAETNQDHDVTVTMDYDGTVLPAAFEEARRFCALWMRAATILGFAYAVNRKR